MTGSAPKSLGSKMGPWDHDKVKPLSGHAQRKGPWFSAFYLVHILCMFAAMGFLQIAVCTEALDGEDKMASLSHWRRMNEVRNWPPLEADFLEADFDEESGLPKDEGKRSKAPKKSKKDNDKKSGKTSKNGKDSQSTKKNKAKSEKMAKSSILTEREKNEECLARSNEYEDCEYLPVDDNLVEFHCVCYMTPEIKIFNQFDLNSDGVLTKEETVEHFDSLDCIFPFSYTASNGETKTYMECTSDYDINPWCSTRTFSSGMHVKSHWKYCTNEGFSAAWANAIEKMDLDSDGAFSFHEIHGGEFDSEGRRLFHEQTCDGTSRIRDQTECAGLEDLWRPSCETNDAKPLGDDLLLRLLAEASHMAYAFENHEYQELQAGEERWLNLTSFRNAANNETANPNSFDGKMAINYVVVEILQGHHQGKKILAFQGTVGLEDFFVDISFRTIAMFGHFFGWREGSQPMIKMIREALEIAKNMAPDFITGHSLGGMLAQMVAASQHIPGAAFNSIGAFVHPSKNVYLRPTDDNPDFSIANISIENYTRIEEINFEVVQNRGDIVAEFMTIGSDRPHAHIVHPCNIRWTDIRRYRRRGLRGFGASTHLLGHAMSDMKYTTAYRFGYGIWETTPDHNPPVILGGIDDVNEDLIFLPGERRNQPGEHCLVDGYCTETCNTYRHFCNNLFGRLPDGTRCLRDRECQSQRCTPISWFNWLQVCRPRNEDGGFCWYHSDCESRICQWWWFRPQCAPSLTIDPQESFGATEDYFLIRNQQTRDGEDVCMNRKWNTVQGEHIETYTCNNNWWYNWWQLWWVDEKGSIHPISDSSLCLEPQGGLSEDRTILNLERCDLQRSADAGGIQEWIYEVDSNQLHSEAAEVNLIDVQDSSNGKVVWLRRYNHPFSSSDNDDDRKWHFDRIDGHTHEWEEMEQIFQFRLWCYNAVCRDHQTNRTDNEFPMSTNKCIQFIDTTNSTFEGLKLAECDIAKSEQWWISAPGGFISPLEYPLLCLAPERDPEIGLSTFTSLIFEPCNETTSPADGYHQQWLQNMGVGDNLPELSMFRSKRAGHKHLGVAIDRSTVGLFTFQQIRDRNTEPYDAWAFNWHLVPKEPVRSAGNVAFFRKTEQSSTVYKGYSSRAVDGGTNGIYDRGSVTHTDLEKDPWWEVDLGMNRPIYNVTLFNRVDCCHERLDDVVVELTNSWGEIIDSVQHNPSTDGHINHSWTAVFSGNTAAKVRVVIYKEAAILSLAEVQVMSDCMPNEMCV